jgi:hypothetical protein
VSLSPSPEQETATNVVALALLAGGFAVTFASAAMGSAVMRLGQD